VAIVMSNRPEAGMPNYRRAWMPGGTWFFTVNLLQRRGNDLLVREIDLLRRCVAIERSRRPFSILAWVVLPEHMHWLWRLPPDDDDFATRWRRIRTDFSRGIARHEPRTVVRRSRGERGIWQRRYWEHLVRDEDDLYRHMDYIHFNPVKHCHAAHAADWPHSSFRDWVERGAYALDWGGSVAESRVLAE
jgi:putative transposase